MPVIAAVVRFTSRDATRRKNVSCRFCRIVPTTSYPASIAATSFGISSGGFWRSGVERDAIFAVRGREARENRHVLAGVAHELDDLHEAGVVPRGRLENLERAVARPVVREDDLVRPREPGEDGQEAREEERKIRLLVVDGHDDGNLPGNARDAHCSGCPF